jgi:hypothetical protein
MQGIPSEHLAGSYLLLGGRVFLADLVRAVPVRVLPLDAREKFHAKQFFTLRDVGAQVESLLVIDKGDELVVWVLSLLERGQEVEGVEAQGLVGEGHPDMPVFVDLRT